MDSNKLNGHIMPSRKSPIKDPIHNYIPISSLESLVIDSPEFQRLRFVFQNSTAFLTFPSNMNTRFSHSLGVMHVCEKYFLGALNNTPGKVLDNFFEQANNLVRKEARLGDVEHWEGLWKANKHFSRFEHTPVDGIPFEWKRDENKHSAKFLASTLLQAIRLASLCHDLGHFPMSHVFEDAISSSCQKNSELDRILQEESASRHHRYSERLPVEIRDQYEKISNKVELHELRGLFLFEKIMDSLPKDERVTDYDKLILQLAKFIMIIPPASGNASEYIDDLGQSNDFYLYGFLHSFFANGFVDADRMDYTFRDPHSSGVNMASVDIDRICSGSIVAQDENGFFSLSYLQRALPAIEVFFHQRYVLYKNIVYHHNVIRMNAILKEIIYELLVGVNSNLFSTDLTQLVESMELYRKSPLNGEDHFMPDSSYIEFDDAWLRTLFIAVYSKLRTEKRDEDNKLRLLLETFLYRKVENLFSLWKRESDFFDWCFKAAKRYKKEGIGEDSKVSKMEDTDIVQLVVQEISKNPSTITFIDKLFDDIKGIVGDGAGDVYVLYDRKVNPKTYRISSDSGLILTEDGTLNAEKLSPYLKSLDDIQHLVPRFYIFLISKGIKKNRDVIEEYRSSISDVFYDFFKNVIQDIEAQYECVVGDY